MSGALSAGARVGPYLTLFRLGKGGMGEVWAATRDAPDPSLDRLRALKVLAPERSGANETLMFHDEARAAIALRHPAIVPTLDLGRDGDVLYFTMELVQGPSLTALLQRLVVHDDALGPAVVAHIGIRLAEALDYAYNRADLDGRRLRLVHRDVSPHNVLLDLEGRVRLTDFGVARTDVQEHRSRVGTVRGKPSYMAPEQVAGGAIDDRTDVFALGIVLYECACLKRLFGRKNPVKSMDAVVRYHPQPLTEMVPGFPPALARVIAWALEKNPDDRPPSASALAEALARAQRSLPGARSAERVLADRIARCFEPDAFDVVSRAAEGLATSARRVTRAGLVTKITPPALDPAGSRLHTRVWPTSPAPDALDPDAIEALRTQLRPDPRPAAGEPGARGPDAVYPMPSPSAATGFTSPTGSRLWTSRSPGVLALAGALALATSVAVGVGWGGRPDSTAASVATAVPSAGPLPDAGAPTREAPAPSPSVTPIPAGPEAATRQAAPRTARARTAEPRPESAVVATAPEATAPEAPPTVDGPRRKVDRRRRGRSTESPGSPPGRDEARRGTLQGRRARRDDRAASTAPAATFAEVRALLREVRAMDPARGRAMLATLVEAGRTNVETLNALRDEARAILGR